MLFQFGICSTQKNSILEQIQKLKKQKISKIEKRILLRYFKTLNNKSAQELLEETDCIIEISPKKYSVWEY